MVKMGWLLLALGGLFTGPPRVYADCPEIGDKPGSFSKLSVDLCFQNEESELRHLEIPSPDGSLLLVVDGQQARLFSKGHVVGLPFSVAHDEEIIWSSDSRALLFTLSFGAAGPVSTGFSAVQEATSTGSPDLTATIRRDFVSHHSDDACHRSVNVAGLTWLDGSAKAVLIAEVPPSPQCEEAGGYLEAYVVSFPDGRIVERYSMSETIRRWRRVFGSRLDGDINLQSDR
jgi:hypothetical protein